MSNYKIVTTIQWNLESDDTPEQIESLVRAQYLFPDCHEITKIEITKGKSKKIKIKEFSLEEVIPFLKENKKKYNVEGQTYDVKMSSHRYFIFRDCPQCVCCDLPITKVFLERHPEDKSAHFNFYGEEDDELILMTKDHILPKSCGGNDIHSNYQTMCAVCNNLKGNANLTLSQIHELKQIYSKYKKKLPKKKLFSLIEETKLKMFKPWIVRQDLPQDESKSIVTLASDAHLIKKGDEYFLKYIYSEVEEGEEKIGCLKKGSAVESLVTINHKVMCRSKDGIYFCVARSLTKT